MGEASEMSSMASSSEVSTADTGKPADAAGGGSKAKILVPVVLLLLVLAIAGALLITSSSADDSAQKTTDSGDASSGGNSHGGGGGGGGGGDDDPTTRRPGATVLPNKVLFCFIQADININNAIAFPDDDTCTHVIVGCHSFTPLGYNFDLTNNKQYYVLEGLLSGGKYKKTEAGLSLDFRVIPVGSSVSQDNAKALYDKKIIHFGLHFVDRPQVAGIDDRQGIDNFKKFGQPFLKSVHDFHKSIAPKQLLGKSQNPLYGFVSYVPHFAPAKPEDMGVMAKSIEDAMGFPLLIIIHTDALNPLSDTECVLGGTPYKLPSTCKKPTMADYLTITKDLTFKHGSMIAASFTLGTLRYDQITGAITDSTKLTDLKKTLEVVPDTRDNTQICDPDAWPTTLVLDPDGAMAALANKEKTSVVAYESEQSIQYKVTPFSAQSTGQHLGFGVFFVEQDKDDCGGSRDAYKRLKKIRDVTNIRKQ